MADNETTADIIAEMREISAEKSRLSSENGGAYGNPGVYYLDFAQFAYVIADRLEAAHKREVDEAERRANHAAMKNVSETLAKVGPLYDAESIGDVAKLRDALNRLVIASEGFLKTHSAKYYVDTTEALDKAKAALADTSNQNTQEEN